jgi:HEPN domain-containing protein
MQDPLVNKLLRAAVQRLSEAEYLLKDANVCSGAIYLAGYAVEMSLKALIVAHTPIGAREGTVQECCKGTRGHDYDYLKGLLKQRNCVPPLDVMLALARVAMMWSTDLRYEPGRGKIAEARSFVNSAKKVLGWARRSIQ